MSAPHPDAIGSLGYELEKFSLARRKDPLRWWQKLAARRLLEYDDTGHLVWDLALLTLSRQVGKSYFLGDLQAWRLESGQYFGGAVQTVVATGKDVAVCLEVMRPYLIDAKERPTQGITLVPGQRTALHRVAERRQPLAGQGTGVGLRTDGIAGIGR